MEPPRADFPTRAGIVATVLAVLGMVIPPFGVASALAAMGLSGVAASTAHRRQERNVVALVCFGVSAAVVVLIVAGNAIYAARS